MTTEELGRQLGFAFPSKAINTIYERNALELEDYCTNLNLRSDDGKQRNVRCFKEEGFYLVSMLAKTSRARVFRAHVAKLLKSHRQERLDEMHEGVKQLEAELAQQQKDHLEDKEAAVRLALSLKPSVRNDVLGVSRYYVMGLTYAEIAKLLDKHSRRVGHTVSTARKLGLLHKAAPRTPFGKKKALAKKGKDGAYVQ